MIASFAWGSAIVASAPKLAPDIARYPAPYALRSTTQIRGTEQSASAWRNLAPWRMIPARSTALPTMNPGTSQRKSSGSPYALQSETNCAPLSEESPVSTPPLRIGWLASTPTARPSSRAKAVMSSGAKSCRCWKTLPSSNRPSSTLRMSKAVFCASGTTVDSGGPGHGARGSAGGTGVSQCWGRYSR